MTFRCEDLREFGLVLVPWSSPDEAPGSATLINNSDRAIVALQLVWRYRDVNGRSWTGGRASHPGILPGHQYQCTSSCRSEAALESSTLVLDGVFFADGEFVGPGTYALWESVTKKAKSLMDVAMVARAGRDRGTATAEILHEIERFTGPPTERPPAPRQTMQQRAYQIKLKRHLLGDEGAVDWLVSVANTHYRTTGDA
jgi:hypothetical protein